MINTLEKVVYKAFGLHVISQIPLPELPQMSQQVHIIDVEITIRDLNPNWLTIDYEVYVKGNLIMFRIPNIAIFSIQAGNKIIVSPIPGYSEDAARLYILGTCMGAILFQRTILPLHGSAIVIDGKAYGFIGDSGAGKSTLASAFLNLGYQLLTDDVIAITFSSDNLPMVTPSYPQQKLWQESLNEFGMVNHQYRALIERETKYAVPVPSRFTTETIPLAGIFELVKTENDHIEIHPIDGLKRLRTLFYHTYRNFLISPSGLMDWHFKMTVQIINKIDLFQLRRPVSRFTANDLPAFILKTIQKENIS